jgi:hypothetical protein
MVAENSITFIPFLSNVEEKPISESDMLESLRGSIVDEIKDSIIQDAKFYKLPKDLA